MSSTRFICVNHVFNGDFKFPLASFSEMTSSSIKTKILSKLQIIIDMYCGGEKQRNEWLLLFIGSMTHLQNIVSVLKRNKVIGNYSL